jgi:transcriptional regulator of acetoin/glycerol metabolism
VERSYAKAVDPQILQAALKKARGNVSAAARHLGKPRALVLRWMKEFDIDPSTFR